MVFRRPPSLHSLTKLRDEALRCWSAESKQFPERAKALEAPLKQLDESLQRGDVDAARLAAPAIEEHLRSRGGKLWRGMKELVLTLCIALAVAGVARQSWFELYEIPTGSMRPTFKEGDRVLASKTAFGINVPFQTAHLAFDPAQVKHGSIVVITGDGIALRDVDTLYFGLFPGKRRYVKRCVGLPGDYMYFYGGKVYCMSHDETKVTTLPIPSTPDLDYVPFLSFEGYSEVTNSSRFGKSRTYTIKQFNIPLGKVTLYDNGAIESMIPTPSGWAGEFSESTQSTPRSIGEFWGIENYAQARLLLPSELPKEAETLGYTSASDVMAYVELRHSPTLPQRSKGQAPDFNVPLVMTRTSWIPLSDSACENILNNLYTARFVVRDGKAYRYHETGQLNLSQAVSVPDRIPNGTYEFYNGLAYSIGFGSYATELPLTHPVYPTHIKELQLFYNVGIEWTNPYTRVNYPQFPSRYAYFRDGGFYLLGHEVIPAGSDVLNRFERQEIIRQSKNYAYFAFQDSGSPVDKNGGFDPEFFKKYGLEVPQGHYMLLGDNHAMSADSRVFGAVPQANIQGTPVLRFWPLQGRADEAIPGIPPQPNSGLSLYSVEVTALAGAVIALVLFTIRKRRNERLMQFRQKTACE